MSYRVFTEHKENALGLDPEAIHLSVFPIHQLLT